MGGFCSAPVPTTQHSPGSRVALKQGWGEGCAVEELNSESVVVEGGAGRVEWGASGQADICSVNSQQQMSDIENAGL